MEVFDAEDFGDKQIDLIGAGAVGSKVAMQIAKLGVENLRVWDGDEVEGHNIPNQLFGRQDIGKPKVQALADRILQDTGLEVEAHNTYIEEPEGLGFGDVVYLMVDSMDARQKIFEEGLKYNINTELVVEVRMGPDNWRVYAFNPNDPDHIDGWTDTLYTDEEAVDQPSENEDEDEEEETGTACDVSQTVGPTSSMLAGHATWQLIRWQQEGGIHSAHQQIMGLPPLNGMYSSFE